MKRLLIVLGLPILLIACTPEEQGLPSEVVLRNAALAGQRLESALFDLDGTFAVQKGDVKRMEGSARIKGALQGGGEQVKFSLETDTTMETVTGPMRLDLSIEVMVVNDEEVYLHADRMNTEPSGAFFNSELVELFSEKWWLLQPRKKDGLASTGVTPDPRLLQAQAEVVRVVAEHGIEKWKDRKVYHYDVVFGQDKLLDFLARVAEQKGEPFDRARIEEDLSGLDAKGELWIDTESFYVHKLKWKIEALPMSDGSIASASFTVQLTDHDKAPPIIPPEDATVFSTVTLSGEEVENEENAAPIEEVLDELLVN